MQVTFKPNWRKHAKAVPFRRNDDMLSIIPAGVILFAGSGITGNLTNKARRFGIPIWQVRGGWRVSAIFHGGNVCRRNTANSGPLFPVA